MDDVYKHYLKVIEENKRLEKKLEIAVEALEEIYNGYEYGVGGEISQEALAKIKDIKDDRLG